MSILVFIGNLIAWIIVDTIVWAIVLHIAEKFTTSLVGNIAGGVLNVILMIVLLKDNDLNELNGYVSKSSIIVNIILVIIATAIIAYAAWNDGKKKKDTENKTITENDLKNNINI